MPVVEIHLLEVYTGDDKARLGSAMTDAVRSVLPAGSDAITVMIHELPQADYFRGGIQRDGAPALPDPVQIVRDYLAAMEARELERAQTLLGAGFTLTFPGAAPMRTLKELIDWSAPRYRFVRKTYETFDTSQGGTAAVVHCHGTLNGEWPDGTAFAGIRFIDRFEIAGGKITRQDVWNDIAEVKAGS
ncbi:MAG: nuclear transport factor 2 family protein [Sulfitobacter sp.]